MSLASEANERRLIGGVDDVVKLMPLKYKWAWGYYNTGNANHWLPQEVNMQKDIEQWNAPGILTKNEKAVVKTALGFFATADSLVANNLVLGVYNGVTAPEVRMFLLRQAYEEAIHTGSYQHIIETLGLDEEEIFGKYRHVEAIYNKDQFVCKLADMSNLAPAKFLEALIDFYVIMEGIFFYCSFAAMFSFKRRNLLPGTVEQFQYIARDELQHLRFGTDLINGIIDENPEIWTKELQEGIVNKIKQAVDLEYEYAIVLLGTGILGLTKESFYDYTRFIADLRLTGIGLPTIYNIKNPFPWMSEITELQKQKNFFETRITDYQTGGALEW